MIVAEISISLLTMGEVSEDCRIANAVPLFRKSSRDKPGNNRLMSFVAVVGKL